MNGLPSKGVSRPPLITPSASPPPHPSLRADVAPPPKRPRLASVSRSSSSRLSVRATDPALDMQKEREASRTRLLDTWSQLAERYSRRLDEDDIVDIRTGEIVKDNGFWRTTRKFNFGEALAVGVAEGAVGEDSQAEESSEDGDGQDELDAFTEAPDFLEEIFAKGLQPIPTAAENRGSSDSNDLQDFLEAEERRREEYGSDVDEEDLEPSRGTFVNSTLSPSPVNTSDHEDDDNDDNEGRSSIGDRPATSSSVYESAREDSASDDELDNWEPTEASTVVVAGGTLSFSEDEYDSEVEFVEPPVLPKPSPVKGRAPPTQLHTPPLSHSSVDIPDPRHTTSSPPRPPSHLPINSLPAVAIAKTPASPSKPKAPKQPAIRRSPSPEVIEISDDEFPALGPTTNSPSPSPPPVPPPPPLSLAHARSRALSLKPEVVISTLPPRPAPVEPSTSNLSRPRPPIEAPKKKSSPQSSPVKTSSPIKKATKKAEPSQKVAGKTVESKSKTHEVRQSQLVTPHVRKRVQKGKPSNVMPSTSSPEVGERPATPPPVKQPAISRGKSSPKDRTTKKRKRTSSEHEATLPPSTVENGKATAKPREVPNGEAPAQLHGIVADASPVRATRTTRQHPSPRSRSKSRHVTPSDHHSQSSSEEETNRQRHRTSRRFASVSTSSNIQPPYTPHATPLHHPGLYPPIADPRAQQIVTQAMQQLAALLWTPTHSGPVYPYTPTHHRFSSTGPGFMHSTPDHPHPYPFSFDPSMSKATLPPSSPEPPSSPVKPRERRKSIVSRSRSRGRRVSFHTDKEVDGWSESDDSDSSPARPPKTPGDRRSKKVSQDSPKRSKEKGKGKAVTTYRAPSSESEGEKNGSSNEESEATSAVVMSKRGQTPGPECRPKERTSSPPISSRLPLSKKASSKPRTRRDRSSRR